ncbi:hypothetical protein NE237_026490 [Protea cynaroides]|uniref:Uncharacterized protein n=1 Tax=Protea cynaroides TaxID=273540 RepID=A0A9Q0H916_9MAGN|nr:hypothetical protein NE237_026490 [Protea cynaroides]
MTSRTAIFCEILIAILLPPLGVFLRHGCCSCEFLICLLLTLLGYIPGIIYAVYAIVVADNDRPKVHNNGILRIADLIPTQVGLENDNFCNLQLIYWTPLDSIDAWTGAEIVRELITELATRPTSRRGSIASFDKGF